MKIESFLRRYFAHQSESEIQQRKNSIQQQERAADILVLLSFVQEY